MKYKIVINSEQEEDAVISLRERGELLGRIESVLSEREELFGYKDNEAVRLDAAELYCFFIEGGRVYALCSSGKYLIKDRLYRLERSYSEDFVKINQSCLVNVSKIIRFTTSFGGSLRVELLGGYRDYISRRQLKSVKERIGLK